MDEEADEGSSPRVRGTLENIACFFKNLGIIPACAGNTAALTSACGGRRDHPRVCGEHYADDLPELAKEGSSPRVRGTRLVDGVGYLPRGIIPACAGNTTAFA